MSDLGLITYGLFGRAVYLDTNVWSELAKDNLQITKLDFLLSQGNAYLALGPYQVLELSRRQDLAHGLTSIIRQTVVCMSARSVKSELAGTAAFGVGFDFFITFKTFTPEHERVWLEQFASHDVTREFDQQRQQLIADRQWGIDHLRRSWPKRTRGQWIDHFWTALDQYLQARTEAAGHEYRRDKLRNPRYYRGLKLHFSMLYFRHYLTAKKWVDSDLMDLLHAFEMAYAHAVITERSMASTLREIQRHAPELDVPEVSSLSEIRDT